MLRIVIVEPETFTLLAIKRGAILGYIDYNLIVNE